MKSLRCILLRASIIALLLPAGWLAAQNPDSSAINKLIGQVEKHAALADTDAATLSSFLNSRLNWKSHSAKLEQIKVHVNDLIHDSNELASLRGQGSPWQQEAIDTITKFLPEMAAHLTTTIQHLNDNQNRLQLPQYRDYARNNEKLIHNASQVISGLAEYGQAKSKSEALEKKLPPPTSSSTGI